MGQRKSIILLYSIALFIPILISCNAPDRASKVVSGEYALIDSTEHFRIEKKDYYYRLSVQNPFAGSNAEEQYIFYPKGRIKPKEVNGVLHYFQTPVERIVVSSTTHLGFLNALNKHSKISGAKNMRYTYDSVFTAQLQNGSIVDLGEVAYNHEKLIQLNADVILSYAIDGVGYQSIDDLRRLNQKAVLIAEFMESDPIDKAKWLEVIALFFGEEELQEASDSIDSVKKRYQRLKKNAQLAKSKPKVMIGLPWKGTWYVAGGASFQAQLIADAHANYLWSDHHQKASLPLDIEYVFEHALEADYWINPGPASKLNEIVERDHRFDAFAPYVHQKIYNQNKRLSNAEGNDYWESAVVKPDIILADLIAIFHPHLLPEHELFYYQKLN